MYALVLVALGTYLMGWNFAITLPEKAAKVQTVRGDVSASNFWRYQHAVGDYVRAHPATTGEIADADLTFPPGYIRDASWRNVVIAGTVYTYSVSALPLESRSQIYVRGGKRESAGVVTSSGVMTSFSGRLTGIVVPTTIPVGAVVAVGT